MKSAVKAVPSNAVPRRSDRLRGLVLGFEPNLGQTDKRARYLARGPGYAVFLTADGMVLKSAPAGPTGRTGRGGTPGGKTDKLRSSVFSMIFAGSRPGLQPAGVRKLSARINHYAGRNPANWRRDIPVYGAVRYGDAYPGVDVFVHREEGRLHYNFIVAPGADADRIVLKFAGVGRVRIDGDGNLVLEVAGRPVIHSRPVTYQVKEGKRQTVSGRFVLRGENSVGFEVSGHDPARSLIIDPVIVLGGGGHEYRADGLAVDDAGHVWISGQTNSADFPVVNPVQPVEGGGLNDNFVVKLDLSDPANPAVVYATYLGGSGDEIETDIAIDGTGNAYVAGRTISGDFPVLNAFQAVYGGSTSGDAYVVKLDPTGGLVFSSFLGGSGSEAGRGIAVDNSGIYVTGFTSSTNFPVQNALQPTMGAGALHNAFVTKFSLDGASHVYSTYLGAAGNTDGHRIAVHAGTAYVTGDTGGGGFPSVNALQPTFQGGQTDGFVARLQADGGGLIFATHLGGDANDAGEAIAVDTDGNALVTGRTRSAAGFPVINAAQPSYGGAGDGFVTKIAPDGGSIAYSTYLGGGGNDSGRAIAVGGAGNAYVTGATMSQDFPTVAPWQATLQTNGYTDAMLAAFDDTGALYFSTYFGGSNGDRGEAVALDSGGTVYAAGITFSADFLGGVFTDLSVGTSTFDSNVFLVTAPPPVVVDLSITKSDIMDPVVVGDSVAYVVTVTNPPGEDATGVEVAEILPQGFVLDTSQPLPPGCYSQAPWTHVRCDVGTLPAGQSTQLVFFVIPSMAGTFTNTVVVAGEQTDPDPANNEAAEDTTVDPAPVTLSVEKQVSAEPVPLGAQFTYWVRIINHGPTTANNIQLIDQIADNKVVLIESAVPQQGTCFLGGTILVSCDLGSLDVNLAMLVTLTARANGLGSTDNSATVWADETAGTFAETTVTTTVVPAVTADLSLAIETPVPQSAPGTSGFHVRVANNTPGTTVPVANLSVVLQAGAVEVNAANLAAGDGNCAILGTLTPPRVECNLSNIAAGTDTMVWIVVSSPSPPQAVTAEATVTSSEITDPGPGANTDSESFQLN